MDPGRVCLVPRTWAASSIQQAAELPAASRLTYLAPVRSAVTSGRYVMDNSGRVSALTFQAKEPSLRSTQ